MNHSNTSVARPLHALEQGFRKLLRTDVPSRPFLCTGSPFGCEVAIVGINPGTATPFDPFWNPYSGLDKEGWLAAYRSDPANARNQTRPRIEILLKALHPFRCVELNIYPYFSRDEQSLAGELRDVQVFEFMLKAVQPKLIFVFGGTPIKEFSALLGVPLLQKKAYTRCRYNGVEFDVYADSHLSRGWKHERVEALGEEFKRRLKKN